MRGPRKAGTFPQWGGKAAQSHDLSSLGQRLGFHRADTGRPSSLVRAGAAPVRGGGGGGAGGAAAGAGPAHGSPSLGRRWAPPRPATQAAGLRHGPGGTMAAAALGAAAASSQAPAATATAEPGAGDEDSREVRVLQSLRGKICKRGPG